MAYAAGATAIRKLSQSPQARPTRMADVAKKLDEVNMGRMTVQTMIFEPAALKLHLAIGSCPSSALPLKPLELGPLFRRSIAALRRSVHYGYPLNGQCDRSGQYC